MRLTLTLLTSGASIIKCIYLTTATITSDRIVANSEIRTGYTKTNWWCVAFTKTRNAHVKCNNVLRDDKVMSPKVDLMYSPIYYKTNGKALKEHVETVRRNRTTLVVRDINMTCDELRKQILPPVRLRPLRAMSS